MKPSIKIENLSKQYRLGVVGTGTLSHDLKRWWTTSIRGKEDPYLKIGETNDRSTKGSSEYVWALKDINLEIEQGDVVGIIGKNGAGKSTLLKLLSRVTKPTTGSIKYNGRIASLLEVGTGFHPEMTGRENIYMNGAIMGMTRAEITSKLDEIVDFAGIERYIDTPVKRYSSGMTVRLGFSIAAHLEPDILVVDEVLAVGDAEFQKKAIGKMQDVSKGGGRTVLFVSHNMAAVKDLCQKTILLANGKVKAVGNTESIISKYLKVEGSNEPHKIWELKNAPGNNHIRIKEIFLSNNKGESIDYAKTNEDTGISIVFETLVDLDFFVLGLNLYTTEGILLFSSHDNNQYLGNNKIEIGTQRMTVWIPKNLLQGGEYTISVAAMRYNPFDVLFHVKEIFFFNIVDTYYSDARPSDCNKNIPGLIRPALNWERNIKIK